MDEHTVNQRNLIKKVAAEVNADGTRPHISLETVTRVLHATFAVIGRVLATGGRVKVSNFGTWSAPFRIYHDPRTGDRTPERRRPKWTPTGRLLEMVRNGDTDVSLRKQSPGRIPTQR